MKKFPCIGSRFIGPGVILNSLTGELQSILPQFSADEEKLQRALLKTSEQEKAFHEKVTLQTRGYRNSDEGHSPPDFRLDQAALGDRKSSPGPVPYRTL